MKGRGATSSQIQAEVQRAGHGGVPLKGPIAFAEALDEVVCRFLMRLGRGDYPLLLAGEKSGQAPAPRP